MDFYREKRIEWPDKKKNRIVNKPTRIVLLDEANLEYRRLNEIVWQQIKEGKENTEEMQILKSVNQKKEFIKANPFYGDNIQKNLFQESIFWDTMQKTSGELGLQNIGEWCILLKETKLRSYALF